MTAITIEREVLDEIVELFDSAITARFPHEILRDLRAALEAPATAPAWHVAPTVPGLWMCNYGDLSVATVNQPDIDTFDPAYNTGGRWYGPIPEDKS